jgi:hypothetical protein
VFRCGTAARCAGCPRRGTGRQQPARPGIEGSPLNIQNPWGQRSSGVKLAVDDFDTENSNLVLTRRFHFDYIKIDR